MITTSYFVTYTISCALKIFSTGLNPWVHYKVHPRQYIWTHCVVAELDFQDELNIKDMYEKYLYPLKLFFCLSIGQEVGIRNFKVCMNGVNRPVDLLLPIEDVNYHEVATHKMLFNLRDIEDNIFEGWIYNLSATVPTQPNENDT